MLISDHMLVNVKDMRIVKINENMLRQIVSRVINEAVGVPDNITNVGETLYNKLINKLDKLSSSGYDMNDLENETLTFGIDDKIADIQIDSIDVLFKFITHEEMMPLAYQNVVKAKLSSDELSMEYKEFENEIDLNLIFTITPETTINDLKDYFVNAKSDTISTFSHELKHTYDQVKRVKANLKTKAEYQVFSEKGFGVGPVDKVIRYLYFISSIENLVRPSEIYSRIQSSNITKKEFYDFFMNDETIKKLITIRDYNFDLFIDDLRQNIDDCEQFLRRVGEYDDDMNEDEVIGKTLELAYINITNWKTDVLQEYLQIGGIQDLMDEVMFGKDRKGEKINFLMGYQESLTRYKDDPIEFYKDEINNSSIEAGKIIKKLSKLFSLVKESKTDSIFDFEKYQKLYKKVKPSFSKKINKYKF